MCGGVFGFKGEESRFLGWPLEMETSNMSLQDEVRFLKGENAILCNALITLGAEKDALDEQLDNAKRRIEKLEKTLVNIIVLARDF